MPSFLFAGVAIWARTGAIGLFTPARGHKHAALLFLLRLRRAPEAFGKGDDGDDDDAAAAAA